MRSSASLLAAVLLGLLVPPTLMAQEDPRSVDAALADLKVSGYPQSPWLFFFRGCPQQDRVGRQVFEAVQDLDLVPYGRVALAQALATNTYPECNYAPLNSWLTQVFRQLHARGDAGPAQTFARGLGPLIDADLHSALLDAAEDEEFAAVGTRGVFADAAIRNRPAERRIQEAIAAFARDIPRQVKADWTYRLGRERGSEFFPALAEVARGLPDGTLETVANAINFDIDTGRVSPDTPGLSQLREHIRARVGLGPRYQIRSERAQSR